MMRAIGIGAAIFAALLLWQCDGESETTPPVAECAAAVTAFTTNIQPHITTDSCDQSGCHASATDPGEIPLKAGDTNAASNRKEIMGEAEEHGWLEGDKMWQWLSGELDKGDDGDHDGKDSLGGLTQAKVTAWVTAEKACE